MLSRLIQHIKANRLVNSLERGSIRENTDSVYELIRIGEAAISPLLRAIHSDDRTTQIEAIRALGHLGVDDVLPHLSGMTHSDDPAVVEVALRAIRRILDKRENATAH